jgi:hypothetical protein
MKNIGLTVRAWLELLYIDLVKLRGFRALREVVGNRSGTTSPEAVAQIEPVVAAVDRAILLYMKPVLCLQQSAAITRLLRRRGVDAELVIGCHLMPFTAHAWVEVAGNVVAVETRSQEYLKVLDRW